MVCELDFVLQQDLEQLVSLTDGILFQVVELLKNASNVNNNNTKNTNVQKIPMYKKFAENGYRKT